MDEIDKFEVVYCGKQYTPYNCCILAESNNGLMHYYDEEFVENLIDNDKTCTYLDISYGTGLVQIGGGWSGNIIDTFNLTLNIYFNHINNTVIQLSGNEFDITIPIRDQQLSDPFLSFVNGFKYVSLDTHNLSKYMIKYIVFEGSHFFILNSYRNIVLDYEIDITTLYGMNKCEINLSFNTTVVDRGSIKFIRHVVVTEQVIELIKLRNLLLVERAKLIDTGNELIQWVLSKSPLWTFMMICKLLYTSLKN